MPINKTSARAHFAGRTLGASLLILAILVGCQAQPAAQPPTAKEPTGALVFGVESLREETFLPWTGSSARKVYAGVMFDSLVHARHDNWDFVPSLATQWTISPDGKVLTFTLRAGVPWHGTNGNVTADDVKYTFDMIKSPASKHISADYFRGIIASVEAPQPDKVIFNLTRADAAFMAELTELGASWIAPKAYVQQVGEAAYEKAPIGSGPYKFVELKSGEYVKYEALKQHWRVVPEFQTIQFRVVAEENSRLAMLRTGEADITALTNQSVAEVKTVPTLSIKSIAKAYSTGLGFGGLLYPQDKRYKAGASWSDPWKDVNVRKAMAMAIDRKAIVDKIYKGAAVPSMTVQLSPGWDTLTAIPYDPDGAKRLIAAAGYPNGFDVTIMSYPLSPGAELPVLVQAVAQYWEAIGLKTKISPIEFATFRTTWAAGRTEGKVFIFRLPIRYDWAVSNLTYFAPDGGLPIFSDARMLAIENELNTVTDLKARDKLFREFTTILYDQMGSIGLASVDDVYGVGARVKDWPALEGALPVYQEYITHKVPLNLFKLYEP